MFEPTCWDNDKIWAVRLTADDYMTVIDASDVCQMLVGMTVLSNLVEKSSVLAADKEAQSKINWLQWEAEDCFDAIDDIVEYDYEEDSWNV